MAQNDLFQGSYSRQFCCPFEEDCEHVRNNQPLKCMFRHNCTKAEEQLRLPNFVCFEFLTKGQCDKKLRMLDVLTEQEESERLPTGELKLIKDDGNWRPSISKCSNEECRHGIHVSFAELEAGFENNPDNQERIEGYRSQFPDIDYQCLICHENVRLYRCLPALMEFAILDNCSHVHCAQCFRSNYESAVQQGRTAVCAFRCEDTFKVLYQFDESKILDSTEKRERFENVPLLKNIPLTSTRIANIIRIMESNPSARMDLRPFMQSLR